MKRVTQMNGQDWLTCSQVGTGYYHCSILISELIGNLNCDGIVGEALSNRGISILP